MTDRPQFVAGGRGRVDVRRLMYQALIWGAFVSRGRRHDPRRFTASLDAQRMNGLTNPLVDSVRRNAKAERDFLRRQMLVDQGEALALSLG